MSAKEQEPPRPLMRELPAGQEYPVDALGRVLRNATLAITDHIQVPPAIAAQSVLAAATLSVQPHADVLLPIGERHIQPVSVDLAETLAGSADRKTTSDKEATWPIRKHEKTLRAEHKLALATYRNAKEAHDAARQQVRTRIKGDAAAIKDELDLIGPEPLEPLSPTLIFGEPSYEGIVRQFRDGLPNLGLFTTEAGGFLAGYAMQPTTILRTATGLSELWDGRPIDRVRAGDNNKWVTLSGRRFATHLMVQPGIAPLLLRNPLLIAQGLLTRFLIVAPVSIIGTRLQREEAARTEPDLKTYFKAMFDALERPARMASGERNELDPRVLPLSTAAVQTWKEFADHVEIDLLPGGHLESVKGFAGKLAEHAARLAATLTLFDDIEAAEISVERLEAGIELAQHYLSEALRLEGDAGISDDLRLAMELLDWLQRWPRQPNGGWLVSLPDIYRLGPRAIRDQTTALRIVSILDAHGWLVRVDGGAKVNDVQRRDVWRIVKA